jgi:AcrR family transcriptional regulator
MGRRPNPQRRVELLADIVVYVQDNGLANLSLRPLAGALGTSTYTLTYQFGNKNEILQAVIDALGQAESDAPYARPGLEPGALLEAYWTDVKDPDRASFHRTMIERATVASFEGLSMNGSKPVVQQLVGESLSRNGSSAADAELQAILIWAAIQGLAIDYIATQDGERLDPAAAELIRLATGEPATIDLQDAPAISLSSTSSGFSDSSLSSQ